MQRQSRQHVRIGMGGHEAPHFDVAALAEHFKRTIGRAVVINDVVVDHAIIVAEEEREHFFLVPEDGVQVNLHAVPSSAAWRATRAGLPTASEPAGTSL